MIRTKHDKPKPDPRSQAEAAFREVVDNVGVRGFYGTASVTVNVQDGHIQYSRVVVDRMVK